MAARLICHGLLRQVKYAQYQAINFRLQPTIFMQQTYRIQALHHRISDADAGLQQKRELNRNEIRLEKDAEAWDIESAETSYRRRRPSRRRVDTNMNKFEVANTNDVNETETSVPQTKQKDTLNVGEDADTFGVGKTSDELVDEGDLEEEAYISRPTRRSKKLSTREYASQIKEYLNAKRLNDAIDVLEVRMLKEDRVKPENYIYNLLISGCAKAGYTRKSFALFTKMRQRGLKITGGTYTSLFNACANAPTPSDGLSKAAHLREIMLEKGYEPNVKNYNAMIKTYGRCGDVKTAYLLADEMRDRKIAFTAETYNFLLQACASDAEFGFRHALLTWHKMLKSGITPDYYSFNAVLRCVRDCGFGDLETMQQVLQQIAPQTEPIKKLESGIKATNTQDGNEVQQQQHKQSTIVQSNPFKSELELVEPTVTSELELPNLLLPQPHLGSLVSLAEVTRPHERFLLLGGIVGFLEHMKTHKITPDIQTLTTMLEVIPPTNAAEKQLITYVRKIGLKADIDFFNVLIKKRSMRFDYDSAKEVLSMIRTAGLQPDIVTYGVLALGCRTQDEARELLQQMQSANVRMNIQILGAMLRQGCAQKSFEYVNGIMQISLDERIRPNEHFLRHLHNFYKQCARAIDARHPTTKGTSFKKGHAKFCDKYRLYYEEHGLTGLKLEDAIQKIKERPYEQFKKSNADEGFEPLKNEQHAKKNKIRKYIKKIKIQNLRNDPPPAMSKPKQLA